MQPAQALGGPSAIHAFTSAIAPMLGPMGAAYHVAPASAYAAAVSSSLVRSRPRRAPGATTSNGPLSPRCSPTYSTMVSQYLRRHRVDFTLPVDRIDAIPSSRPSPRRSVGPLPSHPDGNPGPLHRPGQEAGALHAEVLSPIGERLARPQAGKHLQALVELRRASPEPTVLSEPLVLRIGRLAEPHAQCKPAARQTVHRDGLACQLPGTPPGNRCNRGADADPLQSSPP